MSQMIKRAILTAFNASSYTASILLLEATSTELSNVPIAFHCDGTSALINGSLCTVLFFDEANPSDAVILAVYSNGSGVPTPPPGRITFVTGVHQVNGDTINAGNTTIYTLTGGSSNIPSGANGVLFKASFSSPTVNAFMQLAPHGASDISAYVTLGNLPVANNTLNASGWLALDSLGRIDVKANGGTCTFNLYTYGYCI